MEQFDEIRVTETIRVHHYDLPLLITDRITADGIAVGQELELVTTNEIYRVTCRRIDFVYLGSGQGERLVVGVSGLPDDVSPGAGDVLRPRRAD